VRENCRNNENDRKPQKKGRGRKKLPGREGTLSLAGKLSKLRNSRKNKKQHGEGERERISEKRSVKLRRRKKEG